MARELQQNDAEIHSTLIGAYDLAKDAARACAALLQSIHSTPMNLELYRSLGQRFQAAGDLHNSERAWTSLVEAQPNEAETQADTDADAQCDPVAPPARTFVVSFGIYHRLRVPPRWSDGNSASFALGSQIPRHLVDTD